MATPDTLTVLCRSMVMYALGMSVNQLFAAALFVPSMVDSVSGHAMPH
jgi:hypothetical protein